MENYEQETMKSADVIVTQLERIAVAVETLARLAGDTKLPDHSQTEESPDSMDSGFVFPTTRNQHPNIAQQAPRTEIGRSRGRKGTCRLNIPN